MHCLYLDESGDDGDYLDANGNIRGKSSRYLVVGGILVEDSQTFPFHYEYLRIIDHYFLSKGLVLHPDFKIHYTHLKAGKKFPYNRLSVQERSNLADDMFNAVINFDCNLIAASIDIQRHCNRYGDRVNPKAYMLFICQERLDQFKQNNSVSTMTVYEEFNHIRKKIKDEITKLLNYTSFPNPQNLRQIERQVRSGKPQQHPILQFADFIAHATWLHRTTPNQPNDKFDLFKHKFYNWGANSFSCGYVEI